MSANPVAERADTAPANVAMHPASDSGSLLQIISRAASDPAVDIDKMERLLQMHEKLLSHDAEKQFNTAMTAAQKEMRPVAADADNPQTRSKYATYAALDTALRPIYTDHGFSLSFDEGDSPKPDHIRVLCYVSCGAFTRTYRKDMPADGKGAKGGDVMTKTHASGAAMSYGMRYLLKGIFNVAVGSEDRDGNAPKEKADPAISTEQRDELIRLIADAGTNVEEFCDIGKIDAIVDLPARDFERAKAWLNERVAKRRQKPSAPKIDPKAQFDRMENGQ